MPDEDHALGFDVILGNPPWERVKLQEKEFFSSRDLTVSEAPNAAARRRAIAALSETNPTLLAEFHESRRKAEGDSHLMRNSGRYPLCGRGDINTYAVFAETARDAIGPTGRLGIIVPSGIATDDTTKFFFGDMVESQTLTELLSFENEEFIFPGVHHSYCFSLMVVSGRSAPLSDMQFVFFARHVSQLEPTAGRRFTLTAEDIHLLNPNTLTCPVFRSKRDAEITKGIYRRVPVLLNSRTGDDPWAFRVRRVFDMNNEEVSASCISPEDASQSSHHDLLPVYEAKLMHQFDHRWATYAPQGQSWNTDSTHTRFLRGNQVATARDANIQDKQTPYTRIAPRYWMQSNSVVVRIHGKSDNSMPTPLWSRQWLLAWRDITRANNSRTMISCVLPLSATDFTLRIGFPQAASPMQCASLIGIFNSFVFDFCTRQAISGTHLADYILYQSPILLPNTLDAPKAWLAKSSCANWIAARVLELSYTSHDLASFALDLGYDGPPFHWDETRRACLRAELDAAFFHLYGISRDDADYIMDTFTVFKTRDEQRNDGVYKTKETVLAIFDQMTKSIKSGEQWVTKLDPPPGPPFDSEGSFIPACEWDESDWPTHIHRVHWEDNNEY